jgi:hypothetical protein
MCYRRQWRQSLDNGLESVYALQAFKSSLAEQNQQRRFMAKISVYSIGRSNEADIQLNDPSISRIHAELVVTASDKYYLTDCASSGGSYSMQGNAKSPIRQGFVEPSENLCFGEYHTSMQQLIAMIEISRKGRAAAPTPQDDLPAGPVHRDPISGEIISGKD